MEIKDIVDRFNTTPFLFVGSGITRRYLNLPDWEGLLEHFARVINSDEFSYSAYKSKAETMDNRVGIMPKIAELIEIDFNSLWFSDSSIRTLDKDGLERVKQGVSPFKEELASYIKCNSMINHQYDDEITMLSSISTKSVAGVITTNYDIFLEEHFDGFTKYVGQNQLIFSSIQGVAEIYKIHGSVEEPKSIVINEDDYQKFEQSSAYLAAKLMTIFMEYPIIFMGYSISDSNIQKIIKSIVTCLDDKQLKMLEDRFVFVEYKQGMVGADVSTYTIMVEGRPLTMKKVQLDNFMLLYHALQGKRAKLPVKILRRFKQELYNYTITNVPTSNLRVAGIEDNRIDGEELVMAIGKVSDLGLKGLSGIDSNEWYRDIVMGDLDFSSDDLLEYAFPKIIKQNSGRLPVNKYLKMAKNSYPECNTVAEKYKFDKIISNSFKNNRKYIGEYTSIKQIWNQEKQSIKKATRLMAYLTETQISLQELEEVLNEIFCENINVLSDSEPETRTNIRRLIMIYDYLKWGK